MYWDFASHELCCCFCAGLVVDKGTDGKDAVTFENYSRLEEAYLKQVHGGHKNLTYFTTFMKEPLF